LSTKTYCHIYFIELCTASRFCLVITAIIKGVTHLPIYDLYNNFSHAYFIIMCPLLLLNSNQINCLLSDFIR